MDFEKICMLFSMQEPFYGILLSSMERIPTRKISTMGVGRSGNVFQLHYNPDFVESLSIEATLQALKHETLHVAFNHFSIWEDENPPREIKEIRNIAADMEVNSYCDISVFPFKAVSAADEGWPNQLGTREYFKRLMQKVEQQQQQANSPQAPCNGGAGNSQGDQNQNNQSAANDQTGNTQSSPDNGGQETDGNPDMQQGGSGNGPKKSPLQEFADKYERFDDHSNWPDDVSDTERDMIQQTIDTLLDFAAEEVQKSHGTLPSEMQGRIDQIRKKPKPVTDWKRYFRRYLGNEFTELIRKSKRRESRRFPDAAGNRHQRKSHILVGIDTSGSVSMPEYREFFGQIKTLTKNASFHVVECDSRIHYEYDFRNHIPETLHGGGGTDFAPVVDYFLGNRRKYDALVYFTDGYSDIPKNTPKETLWVISSAGNQNRKRYKINGASVVFIPKK